MKLEDIKKIYFIGIGGIGMSALARYFNNRKVEVFGYDKTETTLTKKLVDEGMKIHFEDDISQIPGGVDLVVFTLSSKKNVPEVSFYNFGCELLVPDFPESTMLHKERRTWLYTKHKSKIIGSMLFLNYEFNEELIKSSGLEYEIISEIPDALLIQNNEYTLPEICELFELRYKRDTN